MFTMTVAAMIKTKPLLAIHLGNSATYSNRTHVSAIHAVCLVLEVVFPVADQSKHLLAINAFKDWKHATGKGGILSCHNDCRTHKQAVIAWSQYTLNSQKGTSVSE